MFAVLTDPTLPNPILLDTVRHAETGHLTLDQARNARSAAGAIGPYQFLERYLPEFGYGMPANIPVTDVQDPVRARELADQYITGYSSHHDFTTPLQKLVAYNAGPNFAAEWIASGAKVEDLPEETKSYIRRAAEYLQNLRNNDMAYLGMPSETDPNVTIAGEVINPELQALQDQRERVDAAIRRAAATAKYPPSRYMDPRLRSVQTPAELDAEMGMTMAMPDQDAVPFSVANPQTQPPAFFNGNPAAQAAPGGGIIAKAQAATAGPNPQYAKMLSQLGQIQRNAAVSGKRRDQSAMAYQPQVSTNDLLIRMGSAALRGSAQGGLEALAGMGEAYSDAQDLNAKGLAAYQKAMAAKDTKGSGTGGFGAIVVNDAISRALPLIGNGWSTGFASYLSAIPGTEAQALKNNLATIKANIGFDKLQAMRDASPTGGALGQVSERELMFLQSVFGSLDQSQSAEELAYNIQLLQYVYNSIVHGEGNHQYSMPVYGAGSPGGSSGIDAATQADVDEYANK